MNRHIRLPAEIPGPPVWAGGYGADRYGVFAQLVLGDVTHTFRWVEPGGFPMGSPKGEKGRYGDEEPRHEVHIERGFWMGETPVTQEFYEKVTGGNPSHFTDGGKGVRARPVDRVSWDDARSFCERLTAMLPPRCEDEACLPSEAEWEYACRSGTTTGLYNDEELTSESGACPVLDRLAWYDENSDNRTHEVKGKAPNAWGLYDMLGNVYEWCEDHWHDSYDRAPGTGRPWVDADAEEGAYRVFRGGGWDDLAGGCRSGYRGGDVPGGRSYDLGFRLVLAPSSTGHPDHSLEQEERVPSEG